MNCTIFFNWLIGHACEIIGIIISLIACVYTVKTYRKSHDILGIINSERKKQWNRHALETLFQTIPFDCIDLFFNDPSIIRDELWEGLRAADLDTFQFDGKEKETIRHFIQELDNFCLMRYKQTPSNHWKFEPLAETEDFDFDKQKKRLNELYERVKRLKPYYEKVKQILTDYQVNIHKINESAYLYYQKKIEELDRL